MDGPWPGPWLALGLAMAGAWPGPWRPGPWLALDLASKKIMMNDDEKN